MNELLQQFLIAPIVVGAIAYLTRYAIHSKSQNGCPGCKAHEMIASAKRKKIPR
ncbi:MAG: hypothetical protein SGI97_05180 [candidate division Zixibacteria bacterium]|nr:hypothetical protein [candidate division Zixibacteria bacterium]